MAKSAQDRLEAFGVEQVCALILDGRSMTYAAKQAGVSIGRLVEWIAADPDRSARTREARTQSALVWDERAELQITQARNPFQLARAKELAHHLRWRASKIAPREYGDRMQHTGGGPGEAPIVTVFRWEGDGEDAAA